MTKTHTKRVRKKLFLFQIWLRVNRNLDCFLLYYQNVRVKVIGIGIEAAFRHLFTTATAIDLFYLLTTSLSFYIF